MARKFYSKRRRAIMARGDKIDHLLVFERDQWVCGICRELIDRRLRGDAWMRASIDHIVPLSKGGLHIYENVQACHWICNMRKGNNMAMVLPAATITRSGQAATPSAILAATPTLAGPSEQPSRFATGQPAGGSGERSTPRA